jgi:hypothetical protein
MCLLLTVLDELVIEDDAEPLIVECFDDGCKDVVVVGSKEEDIRLVLLKNKTVVQSRKQHHMSS